MITSTKKLFLEHCSKADVLLDLAPVTLEWIIFSICESTIVDIKLGIQKKSAHQST